MLFNLSAGDNTSEEVQAILNSFMDEMESVVNTLKTDVGSQLATFKSDVNSKITTLTSAVNGVPKGAVKSVQRGVIETNTEANKAITITTVNPNKCLVLLNTSGIAGTNYTDHATLVSLTATTLTIKGGAISGADTLLTTSWQVIEFY